MSNKYFIKVVLLIIPVFLILTCSKKQKVNTVVISENKEIITEIITNENNNLNKDETKNNIFEYRGVPNYSYGNIWDLLEKYNEEWEENHPNGYGNIDVIPNVFINDYFYVDGYLKYLSHIKVDIDTTEGDTWFSSWRIHDNAPFAYWYNYLYVIDENKNIFKMYRIPLVIVAKHGGLFGYIIRKFPVLENLPGEFGGKEGLLYGGEAWLYDINGDGFDEIIYLYDHDVYQGDHEEELYIYGGTSIYQESRPESQFYILGYNKNIDNFVFYLNIRISAINEDDGPEPVQYLQNQDIWGFRCLVNKSKYTSIYGLQATESEDLIWIFLTWDSDEKKYIEKMFIEE
jgi:hypothetical protein